MDKKERNFTRRDFIKTAGSVGLGSVLLPSSSLAQTKASSSTQVSEQMIVPRRPFGKTGADVSILSLGGVLKISDQLVFRQAFKMGVTYWDTADSYGWGKNERAIGKILCQVSRRPEKSVPGYQSQNYRSEGINREIKHFT